MGEYFFWYRPTWAVPDKRPLNGCVCVCVRMYVLLFLQETLVAECDLGRDYEHCLELQKKVNDTETVSSDALVGHC